MKGSIMPRRVIPNHIWCLHKQSRSLEAKKLTLKLKFLQWLGRLQKQTHCALEAGTGNLDMLDVLLLEPEVNMLDVLLPDVAVVAADNLFGGFLDIIFSTGKILITVLRYFMSEV